MVIASALFPFVLVLHVKNTTANLFLAAQLGEERVICVCVNISNLLLLLLQVMKIPVHSTRKESLHQRMSETKRLNI